MNSKTHEQAVATRKAITNLLQCIIINFFYIEKLWVLGLIRHLRIRVGIVMKNDSILFRERLGTVVPHMQKETVYFTETKVVFADFLLLLENFIQRTTFIYRISHSQLWPCVFNLSWWEKHVSVFEQTFEMEHLLRKLRDQGRDQQ